MSFLGGVFYTDGGCDPKGGYGGYGFHGYTYNDEPLNRGTGLKDWYITPLGYIKTTEHISAQQRMFIWKVVPELAKDPKIVNLQVVDYYDGIGGIGADSHSNLAELEGVIHLFEELESVKLNTMIVYIDSQYVLNGLVKDRIKMIPKGDKLVTKGYANTNPWKRLIDLVEAKESAGVEVIFDWVKGHVGNLGNEKADKHATAGKLYSRDGKVTSNHIVQSAKGYWDIKYSANRLITHPRWYFNTGENYHNKSEHGRFVYHIGKHGNDDDLIGKEVASTAYSVVHLEQPNEVMEILKNKQCSIVNNGYESIVSARLDNLFKPITANEVITSGGSFLMNKPHTNDLYSLNKLMVTRELNPPRLAKNIVPIFNELDLLLNQFINGNLGKNIHVQDITLLIYDIDDLGKQKKCKVKKEIDAADKFIKLDAQYLSSNEIKTTELTLNFRQDIPDRNFFNAIAPDFPTVSLLTWKDSKNTMRYVTIVSCKNDIGIWSGYYTNVKIMF